MANRPSLSCGTRSARVKHMEPRGDLASLDLGSQISTTSQVTGTLAGCATELVEIELYGEVLRCTPAHRFWTMERGWVAAGELQATDTLQNARGDAVPIHTLRTRHLREPVPVYNIEVGDTRCYFVGEAQVLVHNKSV